MLRVFYSVRSFLPKHKASKARPNFSSLTSAFGNMRGHCNNETAGILGGNFLSLKLFYVDGCFVCTYIYVLHMCQVSLEALELELQMISNNYICPREIKGRHMEEVGGRREKMK